MNYFDVHWIWEIDISAGFYGTGKEKTRENRHFHGNSCGWEREIRISTGIFGLEQGNQDLFGNCLGVTTGTILAREPE